ncbi:MAG: DJ-1 family protein, partial [Spirochaetaceae bacterium]|nr:DJ-1 family protein [Spirochaetaceae bacterium]
YPGFEEHVSDGIFSNERVVIDGNLITSRGAGTAGDFSIALIRYLEGDEAADKIAEAVLLF